MSDSNEPEAVGRHVLSLVHTALSLPPGAKVLVMIDTPGHAGAFGFFSQIGYGRAVDLISQSAHDTHTSHVIALGAIISAKESSRG